MAGATCVRISLREYGARQRCLATKLLQFVETPTLQKKEWRCGGIFADLAWGRGGCGRPLATRASDLARTLPLALRARYHAGVTTSQSPREKAAQDAAALVAYLRTVPQSPVVTQLVELGEHLERAVKAFHMEAIRFRAFTMNRLIKEHAAALPGEVAARMEAILHDLEDAGFQTRSVGA